ncbi:MAG: hypothetical protein ABSE82_08345 [Nitrososphaerales archaeon]
MQAYPQIAKAIRASFAEHSEVWLLVAVGLFYLLGMWEHLPFSGGHIYSDIVTVYQNRFCYSGPCGTGLPYVNYFVEYPVITGFFMYSMGMLGHILPLPGRDFLGSYYTYTSIFLFFPTVLLVDNLRQIMEILGIARKNKRTLLFLVATPSFVFMLLLNWYIIGVFFAVFGLRKFLEGIRSGKSNSMLSGILLGLSAAANLITAVPALGILIFGTTSWKERAKFVSGILIALLAVYVPVIILNSFPHSYLNASNVVVKYPFEFPNINVITDFLRYEQNWYAEGSWMLGFFTNTSPLRHYIFLGLFATMAAVISLKGLRTQKEQTQTPLNRANLVVMTSSLYMFAFLFCSYVCTPQMNLLLLPFFVLLPGMTKRYPEFLAFEIVNSLVIVWGFSAPLAFLGINLPAVAQFGPIWVSPIQFLAVVRSFWIGKFLLADGLYGWPTVVSKRAGAILEPMKVTIPVRANE